MSMMPQVQDPAAPIEVSDSDEDILQSFAAGELGKLLGLSASELDVGLTVARNHLLRDNPGEALKIYLGLVLCQPVNPEYQIGLANCAAAMGEHNLAIQAAAAVIALSPANPRGYLISGRSCLAIGCLDEAREDLSDALRFAGPAGDAPAGAEAKRLLDGMATAGG